MMLSRLWKKIKNFKAERDLRRLQKKGLRLGKNVFIQGGVIFDPSRCYLISIGNNCTIAARTYILAHDASMFHWLQAARVGRVDILDNCFIGAGSIILPGVTIGPDTIVGAGSVVTKSLPPRSVCCGNPAQHICDLDSFLNRHRRLMEERPTFDKRVYDFDHPSPEFLTKLRRDLEGTTGYRY